MSRRGRGSSYRGVNKLRRTLRRIPDEAQEPVRSAVQGAAQAVEADMLKEAPVDDGDLRDSIDIRYGRDGYSAAVGPAARAVEIARRKTKHTTGLSGLASATAQGPNLRMSKANKELLFQAWKAHWLEHGTKGSGNHPGITPHPFISPAVERNQAWAHEQLRNAISEALRIASEGNSDEPVRSSYRSV